jgi:hypothetical protein
MAVGDSRRSLEELGRLADEVYEKQIRPKLQPSDDDKFIAIDVDTGEFEIDSDDYTAVMRLRNRIPEAEIWLSRVGQPAAFKMRLR